ncbi:TatD family hydrolase [Luteolibacter algae]|uniref:TatD family hydrolase n=2 Tax=Luteolibacter algae TaxID=454151 RepID=A0ABW5D310_9BACT
MLFDSHNHLQSPRFGGNADELIREMKAVGIQGCVVNATRENDWADVARLAERFEGFVFPAFGIHPWFAHTAKPGWQERLRRQLERYQNATLGEAGVDGWVDSPSMDLQIEVFRDQWDLAAELKLPLTVHCLKAWEELFHIIDSSQKAPDKILMHSFGGSLEIAQRLLKYDTWFSFSGYFLQPRKRKVLEVYKQLPADRILLETDAPDMAPPEDLISKPTTGAVNHPANLRSIAEAFEREFPGGILEQIHKNTVEFWGFWK